MARPGPPVALWRKFWLLFSVMWLLVAALHAGTILATADEVEHGRAWLSATFGVVVPAGLYLVGWIWERFLQKR